MSWCNGSQISRNKRKSHHLHVRRENHCVDIERKFRSYIEEIKWCPRSRSKWLKEGNANMAYFNRVANMRHGINTIHSLIISEGRTIIGEDIKIHIYEYFRQIFGLSESMRIRFLKKIWPPQINLCQLENDFSEEVVKKAIWDLGQNKATGPDDFPIFFFQIFWSSIKQDLLNMLRKMNRGI